MLNHVYRDMMQEHPYGYALYQPESSLIVKPGALGYISKDGRWTPLVGKGGVNINLGAPESLAQNGLTEFNELHAAPPEQMSWGPKLSDHAKGYKLDFKADASLIPAGIPADIGALFKFKTDELFGAILMTTNPVTREALYGERDYKEWCRVNASAILLSWPDIEDHDLIIVTSIHRTARADLRSWQDKTKEITIGFRVSATGMGEVAPSSEWYKAGGDDGWITSGSANNSTEGRVVFFGGLRWTFNKLSKYLQSQSTLKPADFSKLRSQFGSDQDLNSFCAIHDGWKYGVDCTEIGTGQVGPEWPMEEDEDW